MPARTPGGKADLQYISVADFSPGIHQRVLHAGGAVSPHNTPGMATENTFRCIALPDGGLGPLPKRSITYAVNSPDTVANVANGRFTISGFHVSGPILSGPAGGIDACEFHLCYEYIYSGVRRYRWQRHRMWEVSPTIDTLVSINSAEATPATQMRPTFLHNYRSYNTAVTAAGDPTDSTLSGNTGSPTVEVAGQRQPGNPQVVGAWYAGGGANEKVWKIYPDPAAPSTDGLYDISTTLAIEHAIGHQGRAVGFNQVPWAHGATGTWSFNEQIFYTNANLKTLYSATAVVLGYENATGYSCVGSLNSSELLLIKAQGGAYLVRGDITVPTVLRLPGVPSPGNARQQGVSTPIGFIYGVKDGGVWLWNGGESADCISLQLETDFWEGQPGTDFLDYQGRFESFHEWALAPNNWLYDYAGKSWWKIEDPSVVKIMQWSSSVINSRVYGAPAYFVDNTTPVVHGFDKGTPATSFQWESQPLPQSVDQFVKVREFVLITQGAGTVTVTITGHTTAGTTTSTTQAFTTVGSAVSEVRANFAVDATHIQVKIVSDGGSSPAPIIHEYRLGVQDFKVHLAAS